MTIKKVYALPGQVVPVKVWTDDVDQASMDQLTNTASMPFVFRHVAAMPDVHLGYGATIGSVIATKRAIMPAAVGVDIGCGMMAVKTDLNPAGLDLKAIRRKIESFVPVGFSDNPRQPDEVDNWRGWKTMEESLSRMDDRLKEKAFKQMGSLGGGNHFIEICLDEDDALWVMLHSGSRGLGNQIARRHIEDAKHLMEQFHINLPDNDLAYLPEGTKEFNEYITALLWLQDYALQNRIEMMRRVVDALAIVTGEVIGEGMSVNCHHNYAEMENHFGKNVWVTRKGAVRARTGDMGIIPGSMGTRSYIVEGLGNPDSFHSCSHGAGRRMSRKEAKRQFTAADLVEQTRGVECRKDQDVVDEIPAAYKDIDEVMANQDDLVRITAQLHQIICVKG